jgi:hypothetical protein
MTHEETLDNLWIVFAPGAGIPVVHNCPLQTPRFVPILKYGQRIDPLGHSRVIPLRAPSY